MSEASYQSKLIKELTAQGYYVLKLIKTNKNGIPDLLALKKDEIYFIEVKAKNGRLSKLQKFRLEELNRLGFKTAVKYEGTD